MAYFGELPSTDASVLGGAVNLALAQSRPNPFRDVTEIRFAVPGDQATIELRIYDVAGRRVRTLASGVWPGGVHVLAWDGTNDSGRPVAVGVYFYRLQSAERVLTKKLVRLR